MRKLFFGLPIFLFFFTACTEQDAASRYAEVIAKTQAICGFVPTAVTVAEIFGQTEIKIAADIATSICEAVVGVKPGAGVGTANPPKVKNVVVRGAFVK